MSELWFTADLHLGHANIIRHCDRPFLEEGAIKVSRETVSRHDDALIDAINERVARQDVLWILGDFSLSPLDEARAYRERIRCREINFVRGNH